MPKSLIIRSQNAGQEYYTIHIYATVLVDFFSKEIWTTINQEVPDLDKRVRKLKTNQLTLLISYSQLQEHRALRKISASVNSNDFGRTIGLESISYSQISRRLGALPIKVSEILFKNLLNKIAQNKGFGFIRQRLGNST